MTRFPRCSQFCCLINGTCCGCCGKPKIADPAVRSLVDDLNQTFRRMEAAESRVLTTTEEAHEHKLASDDHTTPECLAAGACPTASAAPFNPTIATMLETLRKQHT